MKNRGKTKNKPTLAVLGGGFKGHQLLVRLDANHDQFKQVIALDYKAPKQQYKHIKFIKLDLTQNLADMELAEILIKEKVDILIHTAIPVTPPKNMTLAHELISVGSMYVCNAAAAAKVKKLILFSTTDVYGACADNPNYLTEEHPPRGFRKNRFLKDKIAAENDFLRFAKKHPGTVVTILRNCTIMGPTVRSFKTDYFSLPVIPSILGYDPLMQFMHEDDFFRAAMLTILENHPGIFNLVGRGVLPLSRLIALSGKMEVPLPMFGLKAFAQTFWYLNVLPAPASYIDFLKYLCVAAGDKAEKEMGFVAKYTTREAFQSFMSAERLRKVNLLDEAIAYG